MKQFAILVTLSCAVLAAAAPQGYNYQQNKQVIQTVNLRPQTPLSPSGIYSVPQQPQQVIQTVAQPVQNVVNTVVESQVQVQPQPQPQQIVYQQPQQHQQQFVSTIQQTQQPPFIPAPQPHYVQPVQQQQVVQTQYVQRPAIVTKDIYIHSAPDDTEEIGQGGPQLDNLPIRKNYRIVFIKAPTQNLKHTAAALKRAQASNEEKTVIYVLSKKPDINEIQQHLQLSQTESKVHKPEVYFIKYKTTEEAQRAQQEIQAQYDALGGATHISDEGVAPISTFTGGSLNLGNIVPHIQGQQQTQTQTLVQTTQNIPQHQTGFVPQVGLQTTSLSSSGNFVGSQPSRKYVPAKAFK